MQPGGCIPFVLGGFIALEGVQFGETLLLLVLAGGFVALVELRLRVLAVGVWGLGCGLRCGWTSLTARGRLRAFRPRAAACVAGPTAFRPPLAVGQRLRVGSRGENFDAHGVSAGGRGWGWLHWLRWSTAADPWRLRLLLERPGTGAAQRCGAAARRPGGGCRRLRGGQRRSERALRVRSGVQARWDSLRS